MLKVILPRLIKNKITSQIVDYLSNNQEASNLGIYI